ncbi:MAG: PAAR domain-containing protein [Dehalococcoidia bacterium]
MGQPAARQNDPVMGLDIHIVMIPTPGGEVPTPLPHPFAGKITSGCSTNVKIEGQPAALVGCAVKNDVNHIAMGPRFQKEPNNQGKIKLGSFTVKINGKQAARAGDMVETCNDPMPMPTTSILKGAMKVLIG